MKKDENGLNKRERAILKYIEKEIAVKGYAPSVREICKAISLSSTATVQGYITKLEDKATGETWWHNDDRKDGVENITVFLNPGNLEISKAVMQDSDAGAPEDRKSVV